MTHEIFLIDPELSSEALARIPASAVCVTLRNPAQDLGGRQVLPERNPDYRAIRDDFDQVGAVIVDARRAGVARLTLNALDQHEVDLAAILEVGFAVELHVFLALLFEELHPARATIVATRPVFAEVAEVFFARRGIHTTCTMVNDGQKPGATGKLGQIVAAGRMAAQWFGGEHRVYSAVHRQTTPVTDELTRRGIAVGTPRLNSLLGVGLRRLSSPDVRRGRGPKLWEQVNRLRDYGNVRLDGAMFEAWNSLIDYFEQRLPATLSELETSLSGLDVLQPDFLLAPAWGGVVAHAFRAWSRTANVPFGVVQHGFNIGAHSCTRTRSVDADVLYAWSEQFATDWIEPAWNVGVDIVTLGNPAYDRVRHRAPRDGRTVMLAPAGVLEFARPALLEFWQTSFAMIEARADVRWKLRPHGHGKNTDWIRAHAQRLGAIWSRDSEPDLDTALADVDILVTMVSSIAIDAMVRGILVVLVNHLGEKPLFLPEVCAGYVTDRHAAAAVLDELLNSPEARAAAYDRQQRVVEAHPTSGVAANIAADIAGRLRRR